MRSALLNAQKSQELNTINHAFAVGCSFRFIELVGANVSSPNCFFRYIELVGANFVFLRYGPRARPVILSRGGCSYKRQFLSFFEMGPEHVPRSCVGQVVLTIVVFLRYGPRTRPAILSRGGCSYKRQFLCFSKKKRAPTSFDTL